MVRHLPFLSLGKEGHAMRLQTDRLLLRPPERADWATLIAMIGDYDVAKNLANVAHPFTQTQAHEFYDRMEDGRAKGEVWPFAIFRKGDSAYIGGVGLRLSDGQFELGYWLGRAHWGRGYATEAARRALGFAFHDLKAQAVWAGWFHDNPRSGHVLEKLGFRFTHSEPRDCLARGQAVNCHLTTLAREDFGRQRKSLGAA
jgi:ribosomal-protein-alanine N-acetyltransferase